MANYEVQLTIEGLNATYVVIRQAECIGVKETIAGVHDWVWIVGVMQPQGMAKLMNSNKEQICT